MKFFVVTMSHPDGEGWNAHVKEHTDYLQNLIAKGKLRASGKASGLPLRSGLLIFTVKDRDELDQLVMDDPFARNDLIAGLDVIEWDPVFGAFAAESSGRTSA